MPEKKCKICGSDENVSKLIGGHPSLICDDCHEIILNWIPYHTKNIKFAMQVHGIEIPDMAEESKTDIEDLFSSMKWDFAKSKLYYEKANYKLNLLQDKIEKEAE